MIAAFYQFNMSFVTNVNLTVHASAYLCKYIGLHVDLRDFRLLPRCEICVLPGFYAALNGSLLRTFRSHVQGLVNSKKFRLHDL
jgi:hypothetical protein